MTATEQRAAKLKKELHAAKEVQRLERELAAFGVDRRSRPSTPITSTPAISLVTDDHVVDYAEDPRYRPLAAIYPVVTARMMSDIQHRRFNVKDIPKFTADFAAVDSKDAPEVKGMLGLLRPFEVFCQIVLAFAPALARNQLQLAMSLYRGRLMTMSGVSTFTSILSYHNEFVARAIRIGLDDPEVWRRPYQEAEWNLQAIQRSQQQQRPTAPARTTDSWTPDRDQSSSRPQRLPKKHADDPWGARNGGCVAFNEGSCTVRECKYVHVCFVCQKKDHGRSACAERRR